MSEMWSRGTGQGIGLSGHKNTYSGQATLIDNWTEELYGVQLAANWDPQHVSHHSTESAEYVAPPLESFERGHAPATGMSAEALFRHGVPADPERYFGGVSELAFTDPGNRVLGYKSVPRVGKLLWAGSKHNDKTVPAAKQDAPRSLLSKKRQEWEQTRAVPAPPLVGADGTETQTLMATLTADPASTLALSRTTVPAGGNPPAQHPNFGRTRGVADDAAASRNAATMWLRS